MVFYCANFFSFLMFKLNAICLTFTFYKHYNYLIIS
jgi:hypothetical protein